jgi:hypothetical protein
MSDHTPLLRPVCPDWCTADHRSEAAHADEDGYLHQSEPYRVGLPGHPELPDREQQHLVLDLVAMQQPDPGADVPTRIELRTGPPGEADTISVIATPADLDTAQEALQQAARTLEQWRGHLPDGR